VAVSAAERVFGRQWPISGAPMVLGRTQVDEGKLAEVCSRYGVRELSVFGSAARGETRLDSDIDLLVDFLPQAQTGLLNFAGLTIELAALLGRKVDLVSRNGLKPLIRAAVIEEACRVYAA